LGVVKVVPEVEVVGVMVVVVVVVAAAGVVDELEGQSGGKVVIGRMVVEVAVARKEDNGRKEGRDGR
jgi:hypothetical protein